MKEEPFQDLDRTDAEGYPLARMKGRVYRIAEISYAAFKGNFDDDQFYRRYQLWKSHLR